jgi:hypothetical protein
MSAGLCALRDDGIDTLCSRVRASATVVALEIKKIAADLSA